MNFKFFTAAAKYDTINNVYRRGAPPAGGRAFACFFGGIFLATFGKGVHPKDCKALSAEAPIGVLPDPQKVWLPLSQHIGKPARPVVEAGERVLRGQLVARKAEGVSANIYSPVAGIVKGVVGHITASGKKRDHILIENDFTDESTSLAPLESPSGESILSRIEEAGIVGMGGAGFPTHIKFNVGGKADVLVVNAAECEPYITCDYRILKEYAEEFLRGVRYCMLACGAKNAVIGIEKNKPDAISLLSSLCKEGDISVCALRTRYPQGAEKQLIYSCTGRVVPEGGLPVAAGAVVSNVHTVLSVCRAVEKGTPCYERVMTVSGKCVKTPSNLWVKNGTPLREIAAYCGADENCARIVSGGPMMGEAVFSLKVCTSKTTSSLLFLDKTECEDKRASVCIGCGRCVQACPMGLSPTFIEDALFRKDYEEAKRYGASSCIACGCCSYVCPAKRFLTQSVRLAKKIIAERKI